jgi:hypothetical protein
METFQYGSERQRQFEKRLRRILELPLRQQACCVLLAAELSLPVYKALEKQNSNESIADRFIACFHRWLAGEASDEQLELSSEPIRAALPDDLTKLNGSMKLWPTAPWGQRRAGRSSSAPHDPPRYHR